MSYYVYMIQAGDFVKIGHSSDVDRRMAAMQTGTPHTLKILARLPFASKLEAHKYELSLHHRLREFHHRGEWFRKAGIDLAFKAPATEQNIKKSAKRKQKIKTVEDSRWHKVA